MFMTKPDDCKNLNRKNWICFRVYPVICPAPTQGIGITISRSTNPRKSRLCHPEWRLGEVIATFCRESMNRLDQHWSLNVSIRKWKQNICSYKWKIGYKLQTPWKLPLVLWKSRIFFIDVHLMPQVFQTRERTVDNQDRLLDWVLLELVTGRNLCQKGIN